MSRSVCPARTVGRGMKENTSILSRVQIKHFSGLFQLPKHSYPVSCKKTKGLGDTDVRLIGMTQDPLSSCAPLWTELDVLRWTHKSTAKGF